MPGLIDQGGTTGLAYTVQTGLQWESRIGGETLIIYPGEAGAGFIQLEAGGYITLEDSSGFILLQ